LEQRVGRLFRAPVGVFEEHHAPAPARRRARRAEYEVPGLLHPVGKAVGPDEEQVRVRPRAHLAARGTLAAAAVLAQQRGREGPRRRLTARTRRAGEQPGVRHRARDGVLQLRDDRFLPDELVEGAHRRSVNWSGRWSGTAAKDPVAASETRGTGSGSSSLTRSLICSEISPTGAVASTIR